MQAFQPARRKKATGLDKIPCKLLKLSSRIVGPSLAYIFKSCTCKLMLKSFQTSGKLSKSYTAV